MNKHLDIRKKKAAIAAALRHRALYRMRDYSGITYGAERTIPSNNWLRDTDRY